MIPKPSARVLYIEKPGLGIRIFWPSRAIAVMQRSRAQEQPLQSITSCTMNSFASFSISFFFFFNKILIRCNFFGNVPLDVLWRIDLNYIWLQQLVLFRNLRQKSIDELSDVYIKYVTYTFSINRVTVAPPTIFWLSLRIFRGKNPSSRHFYSQIINFVRQFRITCNYGCCCGYRTVRNIGYFVLKNWFVVKTSAPPWFQSEIMRHPVYSARFLAVICER